MPIVQEERRPEDWRCRAVSLVFGMPSRTEVRVTAFMSRSTIYDVLLRVAPNFLSCLRSSRL